MRQGDFMNSLFIIVNTVMSIFFLIIITISVSYIIGKPLIVRKGESATKELGIIKLRSSIISIIFYIILLLNYLFLNKTLSYYIINILDFTLYAIIVKHLKKSKRW